MTTCFARLMENNLPDVDNCTVSTEQTAYPFSNTLDPLRSLKWKATGRFIVDATSSAVYIDDGAPKTAYLTPATYNTPDLLATHVETQLNSVSAGWSCVYTGFKFVLSNSGSVTLKKATVSGSAWDTLGYSGVDATGTNFVAQVQRNHTSEEVVIDLLTDKEVTSFFAIGTLGDEFATSTTATLTLEANNILDWTTPPLSVTLSRSNTGIYKFLDQTLTDMTYRYWRFKIIDRTNVLGPLECVNISNIYLGDHTELSRNISNGFKKKMIDPSVKSESENGTLYFDRKVKFCYLENNNFGIIDKSDVTTLEEIYLRLGQTTPLFVSLDPALNVSNSLEELTKYVVFNDGPSFDHIITDKYNTSVVFREIL